MRTKKQVFFQKTEQIYVFFDKNINDDNNLWWTDDDFLYAVKTANEEIKRLMTIHPLMERKYALKLLYQPNNIS